MSRFENKVVVITGAAQGIGAELAKAFASEGASVVVADVADTRACSEEIRASGGNALGLHVDVTDNASLAAMTLEVERRFSSIDILINNAGMFATLKAKPFEQIPEDEWDRVMAVNVRGPFQCAKAVVGSMRRNGGGRIINISSGTIFYGPPGLMHYVASKSAIVGLTRVMARELGDDNILVNAIAPGLTITSAVDSSSDFSAMRQPTVQSRIIKREMLPSDLVGAAFFLASPDSGFLSGQLINVDGGRTTY